VDADLDTLVIALYVKIDQTLHDVPELRPWRPTVGITPKLTDAEQRTPRSRMHYLTCINRCAEFVQLRLTNTSATNH
jgi:hypothetical protein